MSVTTLHKYQALEQGRVHDSVYYIPANGSPQGEMCVLTGSIRVLMANPRADGISLSTSWQ